MPLVTSFRNVMQALHGGEIEVYEGIDTEQKVKDAKGKETDKVVKIRTKKDPGALQLIRLKLLNQ